MELHNWNYMSSIDNYGTPYSSNFFCPVGTPYALNKRTGLILAELVYFIESIWHAIVCILGREPLALAGFPLTNAVGESMPPRY